MRYLIILLFTICFPVFASAAVVFKTNFDSNADWKPHPGTNDTQTTGGSGESCNVTNCPNPPPTGWNYYYVTGEWWSPLYHDSIRISSTAGDAENDVGGTAVGRGGTGKAFVKWDEAKLSPGGNAFAADGTIAKLLDTDYPELYARIWIKYKPGFVLNPLDIYSAKIFRIQHFDRGSSNFFLYFYTGNFGPSYIYNSYNSPTYGWRHSQTYRCDPQYTDYYCLNNPNVTGGNALYPNSPAFASHMGDGEYHRLDFYVKMNTYAGSGNWNSDGVVEYSYDGTLIHSLANQKWINSGTDNTIGWNTIDIGGNTENFYNDTIVEGHTYQPGDRAVYTGYEWEAIQTVTYGAGYRPLFTSEPYWHLVGKVANGEQWYAIDDVVVSTTAIPADYVIGGDPVNGVCGSANGQTFSSPPTTNLCSVGTESAIIGQYTWTCVGANGGTTANCSALYQAPQSPSSRLWAVVKAIFR